MTFFYTPIFCKSQEFDLDQVINADPCGFGSATLKSIIIVFVPLIIT